MKKRFSKYLIAAGALALVSACSDDSSSDPSPIPSSQSSADAACASYKLRAPGWVLDLGNGAYWVIDEATAASGSAAVTDEAGAQVAVFDVATGNILVGGETVATVVLDALVKCAANATPDVPATSSATDPASSGSVVPGSSADPVPGSSAGPVVGSSGSVVPGSSADPVPGSSADPVPASSSAELGPDGFPTIESYGPPPAAYTKDILSNGKTGWSSRYWDACKPHCSWLSSVDTTSEETYQAGMTVARNCNIHDVEVPAFTLGHAVQEYWMGYEGTNSACVNNNAGGTYTCTDMAPIEVNENLSYGYVAAPGDQFGGGCGKCFHLQFNGGNHANDVKATHKALKGKHMIVMASNIGYDVEAGQYDMLVPGGGVGAFNALSNQIGVPASGLGANGGGFLTECQQSLGWDNTVEKYQECVIAKCESVFKDWPNLLRGCKWYAEWYMAADNPTYNWEEVECPQYLIDHYMTTFNTTKENRWRWHDDWSSYKAGDELDTVECWNEGEDGHKSAGCNP